jgi:NAD(P)-dependent dehydrogenase (short-subunit alcohol dehydrogenase family)
MANRPRHVLITGGSRGIGLAIAQLFSKNAYRCTLISRSEKDLKTAVASLTPLPSTSPQTQAPSSSSSSRTETSEAASEPPEPTPSYQHGYIAGNISHGPLFWTPNPSFPFAAHLPRPERERTAFSSHPSRIDVVVNCAGVTQAKLFSALKEEDIDSIVRTNLTSMMLGTKFLLRYVVESILVALAPVLMWMCVDLLPV